MAHVAISVDWYGPYGSITEAQSKRRDYREGLYVAIGQKKIGDRERILYIGLSNNPAGRVGNNHPTLASIEGHFHLWLGEISSTGKPGARTGVRSTTLDLAESALIYGLQPVLNARKLLPPTTEISVLSRWWKRDYETEILHRPHREWADIVDYRGGDYGIRLGWATWHHQSYDGQNCEALCMPSVEEE